MQKCYILIPLLLILSGCGAFSSKTAFTPAKGFQDVKLTARSVPAKITQESDKALEGKDYIRIGTVRLEDEVNSCWDKDCQDFKCTDDLPHKDMTKEAIDTAAAQGGDLLILESTAKREITRISKDGPCSGYQDRYVQVPYCCKQGRGYCESTCYKETKQTVCVSWLSIYGSRCSFITSGNVWRYDLALKQRDKHVKEYKRLTDTYQKNYKDKYWSDEVKYPENFSEGSKHGFKDKNGNIVITPKFSGCDYLGWSEGLRAVSSRKGYHDNWGFIDKTGKWVIQPSYDVQPGRFKEGLAAVSVEKRWGFINNKGVFVIKPQFANTLWFSEGLAPVAVDNKWGYVDKQGHMVIKPQFGKAHPFSEGLAPVAIEAKWGYIDKQGNFVMKLQFDYAEGFVKGITRVVVGKRWRIINKGGELLADDIGRIDGTPSFSLK
jgi:hypothetical protein